jgi:beta-lactamase superfamily II metal-dependent hydrolase
MAKLYFLGNSTPTQMLGIVIKTAERTIVIDGGTQGDSAMLADFLIKRSGGAVDAWFFTHPHHDHIGAFVEICKSNPEILIKKIICNFPSIAQLKKFGTRDESEYALWNRFFKILSSKFKSDCICAKAGDIYDFGEITVSVLRVFNEEITCNFVNNSSSVYRIDSADKRVLILGDLGAEGGDEVMKNVKAADLIADYTQLAHHGQSGVSKEFYEYIKPKTCLWAAPDWLWNNDKGGGFDTGPWQTVRTREWMDSLGVENHIIEKDGTAEIQL